MRLMLMPCFLPKVVDLCSKDLLFSCKEEVSVVALIRQSYLTQEVTSSKIDKMMVFVISYLHASRLLCAKQQFGHACRRHPPFFALSKGDFKTFRRRELDFYQGESVSTSFRKVVLALCLPPM